MASRTDLGAGHAPPEAPRPDPPPAGEFYTVLIIVVIALTLALATVNFAVDSAHTASTTTPSVPNAPPTSGVVTFTSVVAMFNYGNGSASGALGTTGEPVRVVSGENSTLPHRFYGGQYIDWKILVTNHANNTSDVTLLNYSAETRGVNWQSSPTDIYIPYQWAVNLTATFVAPYTNYTGPLTIWFAVNVYWS